MQVLRNAENAPQLLAELCVDHPSYVYGQCLRGFEFLQRGDVKTAMEAFRIALQNSEEDYRVWLGFGDCYVFQKEYKTAIAHYSNAVTLFPHCAIAYTRLVQTWMQLEEVNTAQRVLSKGLSINGEDPGVGDYAMTEL